MKYRHQRWIALFCQPDGEIVTEATGYDFYQALDRAYRFLMQIDFQYRKNVTFISYAL